jgi:hypothetical protein
MATATTTRKAAPAKATKRTAAPAQAASAPAPAASNLPAPEAGTVLAVVDYTLARDTKTAHAYEVSGHVDGTEGLARTTTQYLDAPALAKLGVSAPRKIRVYVEVVE